MNKDVEKKIYVPPQMSVVEMNTPIVLLNGSGGDSADGDYDYSGTKDSYVEFN